MSFKRFAPEDITIDASSITSTLWTGNTPKLTTFFTSSTQESSVSGQYYLDVYNTGSGLSGAEVQFSLEYGHRDGSGSVWFNTLVSGSSPTRTIYGQYRTLINGDENTNFNFGVGNTNSKDVFIININRSRYKEKLFPGSLILKLKSGSNEIQLTDDSRDNNIISYCDAGRIYNLVSGSNGSAISVSFPGYSNGYTPSGSYGYLLPDVGLIVLNPQALLLPPASGGIILNVSSSYNAPGNNNSTLYKAISSSLSFKLNSEETISSQYIFVYAKSPEFNYTTNPSFVSSSGEVIHSSFTNYPQTFITTVGLYNDNNELLAVAKLSRPLVKDFVSGPNIRIKLDY
jgi:hypothetical protein